jgi:hypothetical protein
MLRNEIEISPSDNDPASLHAKDGTRCAKASAAQIDTIPNGEISVKADTLLTWGCSVEAIRFDLLVTICVTAQRWHAVS